MMMEVAFTLAGGGLLAWGAFLSLKRNIFVRKSAQTKGVVLNHIRTRDFEGKDTYFPIIQFKTANEKIVQFKSRTSFNRTRHQVGEEIPVLYDPESPSRAEINSFLTLWIYPVSILGVGIIILTAGLFFGE